MGAGLASPRHLWEGERGGGRESLGLWLAARPDLGGGGSGGEKAGGSRPLSLAPAGSQDNPEPAGNERRLLAAPRIGLDWIGLAPPGRGFT